MTTPEGFRRSSLLERALALTAVMIPIATTIIAGLYASASARRDAGVRLTELAIGILRSPVTAETRGLRGWAVKVVNEYSEVDLPDDVGRALTDSVRLVAASYSAPLGGLDISPTGNVKAIRPGRCPLVACSPSARLKQCDTSWNRHQRFSCSIGADMAPQANGIFSQVIRVGFTRTVITSRASDRAGRAPRGSSKVSVSTETEVIS
jgi:hypothetical protein